MTDLRAQIYKWTQPTTKISKAKIHKSRKWDLKIWLKLVVLCSVWPAMKMVSPDIMGWISTSNPQKGIREGISPSDPKAHTRELSQARYLPEEANRKPQTTFARAPTGLAQQLMETISDSQTLKITQFI